MPLVIKIRPIVRLSVHLVSIIIWVLVLWQANIHILRLDPALVPYLGILTGVATGAMIVHGYRL